MRKVFYAMIFLLLTMVLAGCISLPLGNNNESDTNEMEETEEIEEAAENENDANTETEPVTVTDQTMNNNADNMEEEEVEECDIQDHSEVLDELSVDLFIPECAILMEIKEHSLYITAYFILEDEDWETVYNEYKNYLGGRIDEDNMDFQAEIATFGAYIVDDDEGYTKFRIEQAGKDVNFQLTHYFP